MTPSLQLSDSSCERSLTHAQSGMKNSKDSHFWVLNSPALLTFLPFLAISVRKRCGQGQALFFRPRPLVDCTRDSRDISHRKNRLLPKEALQSLDCLDLERGAGHARVLHRLESLEARVQLIQQEVRHGESLERKDW